MTSTMFCWALPTSRTRTGPSTSMSSRSVVPARVDMFLKIRASSSSLAVLIAIAEAHDRGQRLDAARLGEVAAADQQPAPQQFVELLEDLGRGLLQDRDAHRDVALQ